MQDNKLRQVDDEVPESKATLNQSQIPIFNNSENVSHTNQFESSIFQINKHYQSINTTNNENLVSKLKINNDDKSTRDDRTNSIHDSDNQVSFPKNEINRPSCFQDSNQESIRDQINGQMNIYKVDNLLSNEQDLSQHPKIHNSKKNILTSQFFRLRNYKNLQIKCKKLSINIEKLISNEKLFVGRGLISYIHQKRDIGQIQLDTGEQVRFHKIDFKKQQYLVTIMYCLNLPLNIIYSCEDDPYAIGTLNREVLMIDIEQLFQLKHISNKFNFTSKNYWQMLGNCAILPQVMKRQQLNKLKHSNNGLLLK